MSVLAVFLVLVLIGVLLWAVTTYIPMAPPLKNIIVGLAVILTVCWLLNLFGLFDSLGAVRVGHVRW